MNRNADTITMGGNRFDVGPKVLEKTGKGKAAVSTDLFIKSDAAQDIYVDGFEKSLEKVSFK